jgi:hypothetical protein
MAIKLNYASQSGILSSAKPGARHGEKEVREMSNWEFGFTMIVVGMGGTLVVLALFATMMGLLKRVFPGKEGGPEVKQ